MNRSITSKIGIIDFNPDQNPDRRQYIRRIGALIPKGIEYEGFHFKDDVDFSGCGALILSGSKFSATDYQRMVRRTSVKGTDYESIDRLVKNLSDYQGPMFGICFGAQLIAHIMGGNLGKLSQTEAGYLQHQLTEVGEKDAIFSQLPKTFYGAHLHTDYVETLPQIAKAQQASVIAVRNSFIHVFRIVCANSAVRYGVQPHPEMSSENDAVFLVEVNRDWLKDKIGEFAYNKALTIPANAEYQLAQTITRFAESIK